MKHLTALSLLVTALLALTVSLHAAPPPPPVPGLAPGAATIVRIPAHWLPPGGVIDDKEINTFFASAGLTVVQRDRGSNDERYWDIHLAEDLNGAAKATLEGQIESKINSIQWVGGS